MTEMNMQKSSDYMEPKQAFRDLELAPRTTNEITEFEGELRTSGIARVKIPIRPSDFASLSEAYEVCIRECPGPLAATAFRLDERYGSELGQSRKESRVVGDEQISDAKNLFHFGEMMRTDEWKKGLGDIPASLETFLEMGIEVHQALARQVAQKAIGELEKGSYANLSRLYLPEGKDGEIETSSVLRVIRYDSYEPFNEEGIPLKLGAVAVNHFDIGGLTIQAYTDGPGFWTNQGGNLAPHQEREYQPTDNGKGYLFVGQAHRRLYGPGDPIQPLWHGVDRVIPTDRQQALVDGSLVVSPDGKTRVPERTAVIFFGNAPHVDPGITARDTKPNIGQAA